MKYTTVQIEGPSGYIDAVIAIVRQRFAVDIVDAAVGNPGRAHDVIVIIDRVGLKRPSRRISAGPQHQLYALVGQLLPKVRPIHVKADRQTDPSEIRRANCDR